MLYYCYVFKDFIFYEDKPCPWFVGITVDDKLRFQEHLKSVLSTVSQRMYIVKKICIPQFQASFQYAIYKFHCICDYLLSAHIFHINLCKR